MTNVNLVLPDFLLIALGCLLCRRTVLGPDVWRGVESLVYYLLFPVLLFSSTVHAALHLAQTAALAGVGALTIAAGMGLAVALGRWPGVDPHLHASGAQTAFRFNSYIALALAERLGGTTGVASMALLIAICVPWTNAAAVWLLARRGEHQVWREVLYNPLIISTVGGLIGNGLDLGGHIPPAVDIALQRVGSAALPMGLLAVGAGLRLSSLQRAPVLASTLLGIRHAALPLVALGLSLGLALPPSQRAVAVAFAALPTASSAYVITVRLGGDAAFVATLVTVSTLLGMVSVPAWLAVARALFGA